MKKLIYIILFIIISSYIIYVDIIDTKKKCLEFTEDFKKQVIIGKVVRKYEDSNDHNKSVIEVIINNQITRFDFTIEKSMAYEYVIVNDSIFKSKNDLNLRIRRNGNDSVFFINFNCE